eukprot:TRINITY_DN37815_c0_g1_i1.p1 TRINITY_DN37815_c0_g1~~TRINITY_DN37815_c0_g1_i1.p1  ORF type:complete len:1339 (-),score=217.60 TRINITY_DN37815_c0_g1_i1:101-3541(-)
MARFLNERHANKYLLVDLAEHRRFPTEAFFGRYIRCPMRHSEVPSLKQMWQLCELVQAYLQTDENNIVVFLSRDNRGRVSLAVVCYLLYHDLFTRAAKATSFFERRRTRPGGRPPTSMETASQQRFTEYFAQVLLMQRQHGHSAMMRLMCKPRAAEISSIRVEGLGGETLDTLRFRSCRHFCPKECDIVISPQQVDDPLVLHSIDLDGAFDCEDATSSIATSISGKEDPKKSAKRKKENMQQLVKMESSSFGGDDVDRGCFPLRVPAVFDTCFDTLGHVEDGRVTTHIDISEKERSVKALRVQLKNAHVEGDFRVEVYCDANQLREHTARHRPRRYCSCRRRSKGLPAGTLKACLPRTARTLSESPTSRPAPASPSAKSVNNTEEDVDGLMLSFWLHTNFLELNKMKPSEQMLESADLDLDDKQTVAVVLTRFDLDKAAFAPNVFTYSTCFEINVAFKVALEPLLDYTDESDSQEQFAKPNELSFAFAGSDQLAARAIPEVNWLVKQVWPFVEAAAKDMLMKMLPTEIDARLPSALRPVKIQQFCLGHEHPVFGPLLGTRREDDGSEIQFIMHMSYDGDISILLDVGGFADMGVKRIVARGTLSVKLRPLMSHMPVVGGVQVAFLNEPDIDITFAGKLQVANHYFVRGVILDAVKGALHKRMVMPNAVMLTLDKARRAKGDPLMKFGQVLPHVVMQVHVQKAKGLRAADWHLLKTMRTSDPYCVIQVGSDKYKTKVIKGTVEPVWGETIQVMVYDLRQSILFRIYDSDLAKKDDVLAQRQLSVVEFLEYAQNEEDSDDGFWLQVNDTHADKGTETKVEPGEMLLAVKVFDISRSRRRLEKVVNSMVQPTDQSSQEDSTTQRTFLSSDEVVMARENTQGLPEQAPQERGVTSLYHTTLDSETRDPACCSMGMGQMVRRDTQKWTANVSASSMLASNWFCSPNAKAKRQGGPQNPELMLSVSIPHIQVPHFVAANVNDASVQLTVGSTEQETVLSPKPEVKMANISEKEKLLIEKLAATRLSALEIATAMEVDQDTVSCLQRKGQGFNGEMKRSHVLLMLTAEDIQQSEGKLHISLTVKGQVVASNSIPLTSFLLKHANAVAKRLDLLLSKRHPNETDSTSVVIEASLMSVKEITGQEIKEILRRINK